MQRDQAKRGASWRNNTARAPAGTNKTFARSAPTVCNEFRRKHRQERRWRLAAPAHSRWRHSREHRCVALVAGSPQAIPPCQAPRTYRAAPCPPPYRANSYADAFAVSVREFKKPQRVAHCPTLKHLRTYLNASAAVNTARTRPQAI
jgi:hypothetical protein